MELCFWEYFINLFQSVFGDDTVDVKISDEDAESTSCSHDDKDSLHEDEEDDKLTPLPSSSKLQRHGAVRYRGFRRPGSRRRNLGNRRRTYAFKTFRKPGRSRRKSKYEDQLHQDCNTFARRFSNAL